MSRNPVLERLHRFYAEYTADPTDVDALGEAFLRDVEHLLHNVPFLRAPYGAAYNTITAWVKKWLKERPQPEPATWRRFQHYLYHFRHSILETWHDTFLRTLDLNACLSAFEHDAQGEAFRKSELEKSYQIFFSHVAAEHKVNVWQTDPTTGKNLLHHLAAIYARELERSAGRPLAAYMDTLSAMEANILRRQQEDTALRELHATFAQAMHPRLGKASHAHAMDPDTSRSVLRHVVGPPSVRPQHIGPLDPVFGSNWG